MSEALAIAMAGALGAPARYLLDRLVQQRVATVFPWGTFVINASGAFLLGLVTGLALHGGLGPLPRAALGTGFCGAYSTFSTFTYETVRLVEDWAWWEAAVNVAASLGLGLLAAGAGLGVALSRLSRSDAWCRLNPVRSSPGRTAVRLHGHAKRLTIYCGEADHHGHLSLVTAIVERARDEGLAGATVLRGIEGFGASSHLHTTRILSLSDDLPIVIDIVDDEDRIRAFLPVVDEMIADGLVTVQDLDVVAYRGAAARRPLDDEDAAP